jgi:hypothetical protein
MQSYQCFAASPDSISWTFTRRCASCQAERSALSCAGDPLRGNGRSSGVEQLRPISSGSRFCPSAQQPPAADKEGAGQRSRATKPRWPEAQRASLNRRLEMLNEQLKQAPDSAGALCSRAVAKFRLGRLSSALADLDRADQLQPGKAFTLMASAP